MVQRGSVVCVLLGRVKSVSVNFISGVWGCEWV